MGSGGAVWLGLDIGGTKVAAGLVDEEGEVRERAELPTLAQESFSVSFGQVVAVARVLLDRAGRAGWTVRGVGAGCPGPLDVRTGVLHGPPNLPAWDGAAVGDLLRDALGLPAVVDNDANAAALGEARHGAGRGLSPVVYFTLGTGVGGGVVCDGRLFRGARGAAAELGHLIVRVGGSRAPAEAGGVWKLTPREWPWPEGPGPPWPLPDPAAAWPVFLPSPGRRWWKPPGRVMPWRWRCGRRPSRTWRPGWYRPCTPSTPRWW